jgi:hypothetical protein
MAKTPKTKKIEPVKFCCEFCNSSFVTERSLISHSCEKKRRWFCKEEKYPMMGFRAYQRFYELAMRAKTPKSQEDFINSKHYSGFVRFGKYLVDIHAIEPLGFVDFLIKTNIKLDDWTKPRPYEIWIRELGKKESYEKAIERSLHTMEGWAENTGNCITDFFRMVSPQLATGLIKIGKISPWLLFISGEPLLVRMSKEQIEIIQELIDPHFWSVKFKENAEEVKEIKNCMKEVGFD